MNKHRSTITRRAAVKQVGLVGAIGTAAASADQSPVGSPRGNRLSSDRLSEIGKQIQTTRFVDTHEHLFEEADRLSGKNALIRSNDWSFLLAHYANSDLVAAGMSPAEYEAFFGPGLSAAKKWELLAPYWPAICQTGYGKAVQIAVRTLYGIAGLRKDTIPKLEDAYHRLIAPGFYRRVLQEVAQIESCQVNYIGTPFMESKQPLLLMQDLKFVGMHIGPNIEEYAPKTGIQVRDLADWHRVIDWWFTTYGPYAVAIKSQAAYQRGLDYDEVPAERAAPVMRKQLAADPISAEERKTLEDHLFWYVVRKATEWDLPVKIHTGYYAGENKMPLGRVAANPACATDLCRKSPDTRFVFMHIGYPYYEPMIALAKHYSNANIDMCWAWIVSPVASVNFLKQYLVTAPANKLFTFGGDYFSVEPVVGHAAIARRGLELALRQLVDEGWLSVDEALNLVEPIMRGNARRLFSLDEKEKKLRQAPWAQRS